MAKKINIEVNKDEIINNMIIFTELSFPHNKDTFYSDKIVYSRPVKYFS